MSQHDVDNMSHPHERQASYVQIVGTAHIAPQSYRTVPAVHMLLDIKTCIELMRPLLNTPSSVLNEACAELELRAQAWRALPDLDQWRGATIEPVHKERDALVLHRKAHPIIEQPRHPLITPLLSLSTLILQEMMPDEALEYLQGYWNIHLQSRLVAAAHCAGYQIITSAHAPYQREPNKESAQSRWQTPPRRIQCEPTLRYHLSHGGAHIKDADNKNMTGVFCDRYDALAAELTWMRHVICEAQRYVTSDFLFWFKLGQRHSHGGHPVEMQPPMLIEASASARYPHDPAGAHLTFDTDTGEYKFDAEYLEGFIGRYDLTHFFDYLSKPVEVPHNLIAYPMYPITPPLNHRQLVGTNPLPPGLLESINHTHLYQEYTQPEVRNQSISNARTLHHITQALSYLALPTHARPPLSTIPQPYPAFTYKT